MNTIEVIYRELSEATEKDIENIGKGYKRGFSNRTKADYANRILVALNDFTKKVVLYKIAPDNAQFYWEKGYYKFELAFQRLGLVFPIEKKFESLTYELISQEDLATWPEEKVQPSSPRSSTPPLNWDSQGSRPPSPFLISSEASLRLRQESCNTGGKRKTPIVKPETETQSQTNATGNMADFKWSEFASMREVSEPTIRHITDRLGFARGYEKSLNTDGKATLLSAIIDAKIVGEVAERVGTLEPEEFGSVQDLQDYLIKKAVSVETQGQLQAKLDGARQRNRSFEEFAKDLVDIANKLARSSLSSEETVSAEQRKTAEKIYQAQALRIAKKNCDKKLRTILQANNPSTIKAAIELVKSSEAEELIEEPEEINAIHTHTPGVKCPHKNCVRLGEGWEKRWNQVQEKDGQEFKEEDRERKEWQGGKKQWHNKRVENWRPSYNNQPWGPQIPWNSIPPWAQQPYWQPWGAWGGQQLHSGKKPWQNNQPPGNWMFWGQQNCMGAPGNNWQGGPQVFHQMPYQQNFQARQGSQPSQQATVEPSDSALSAFKGDRRSRSPKSVQWGQTAGAFQNSGESSAGLPGN
jgi:hypothetical protein